MRTVSLDNVDIKPLSGKKNEGKNDAAAADANESRAETTTTAAAV